MVFHTTTPSMVKPLGALCDSIHRGDMHAHSTDPDSSSRRSGRRRRRNERGCPDMASGGSPDEPGGPPATERADGTPTGNHSGG